MPVSNEDLLKVPKDLELKNYYGIIYQWFHQNKNLASEKQEELKKYGWGNIEAVEISNQIIEKMPDPDSVTNEDIVFICREILFHYLEWSYQKFDLNGVKISAYAQHILDVFFPNKNHETMGKESSLYSILPKK